jgi:hypothetical protein
MRRETSRVSFLMCPSCVRVLMPHEATHFWADQNPRGEEGRSFSTSVFHDTAGTGEGLRRPRAERALECFDGSAPSDTVVRGNHVACQHPADLVYDGSGQNNRLTGNGCETSVPDGLCR